MPTISFEIQNQNYVVQVATGTLLSEAARQAHVELNIPCGGQGRCGRCAVMVKSGQVRLRSTARLTTADLAAGYALACQAVIESDAVVTIPPQEKVERRLITDKTATKITLPFIYDPARHQPMRLFTITMEPPSMADQTDDWSRLKRALEQELGIRKQEAGNLIANFKNLIADLPTLRRLGQVLREANWTVSVVVESGNSPRLVDVQNSKSKNTLFGVAVDIGTTTVSLYLVDLLSGEVLAKAAEYNGQIKRGEDVISRIIYAGKGEGLRELQSLVIDTINELITRVSQHAKISPLDIYKMTIAGNSTMIHLLLGLSPNSIRFEPFITTINQPPPVRAHELGLNIHPQANVDCLPGIASYVGADITAGVGGLELGESESLFLFLDVGTNGEMVLGDGNWLISCACSAGPAFEGAGVQDGMRATTGAIEEVWINNRTYEPTYRVIGNQNPKGLCGSGLISLLAELFITGAVDKAGNLNFDLESPRIRRGAHGAEYVVAWGLETEHGRDIVLTKVDIDNLIRAKGAIYAGFTILAESVGLDLAMVERVLIGGSFGQYLNIEKAVQIGLLPDVAWSKFHFLGNTALHGALLALLNRDYRQHITEIASKMTYLELSADNTFYDQFTSALFLPHTNIDKFPSVEALRSG